MHALQLGLLDAAEGHGGAGMKERIDPGLVAFLAALAVIALIILRVES